MGFAVERTIFAFQHERRVKSSPQPIEERAVGQMVFKGLKAPYAPARNKTRSALAPESQFEGAPYGAAGLSENADSNRCCKKRTGSKLSSLVLLEALFGLWSSSSAQNASGRVLITLHVVVLAERADVKST